MRTMNLKLICRRQIEASEEFEYKASRWGRGEKFCSSVLDGLERSKARDKES